MSKKNEEIEIVEHPLVWCSCGKCLGYGDDFICLDCLDEITH